MFCLSWWSLSDLVHMYENSQALTQNFDFTFQQALQYGGFVQSAKDVCAIICSPKLKQKALSPTLGLFYFFLPFPFLSNLS